MRRNNRGSKLLAVLLVLAMLLCSFPMVYAEDAAAEIFAAKQEYMPEIEQESVMVAAEPAAESELAEVPEEESETDLAPVAVPEEVPVQESELVEVPEEEPAAEAGPVEAVEEEPAAEVEPAEVPEEEPEDEFTPAEAEEEEAKAEVDLVEIPEGEPTTELDPAVVPEEEPVAESDSAKIPEEEPAAEPDPAEAGKEEPAAEADPAEIPEETPEEYKPETEAETEAEVQTEEKSEEDGEASEDTVYESDDDEVGLVSEELAEIFSNPDVYERIEFTGTVDIELKDSEICYDRDVTLVARVSGADMEYRLVWEANDGNGWFAVASGEEYTFLLTSDIVNREYRVVLFRVL